MQQIPNIITRYWASKFLRKHCEDFALAKGWIEKNVPTQRDYDLKLGEAADPQDLEDLTKDFPVVEEITEGDLSVLIYLKGSTAIFVQNSNDPEIAVLSWR